MIPAGRYRAKAKSWGLGETSTGRDQVVVECEILEEGWQGNSISWFGTCGPEQVRAGMTMDDLVIESLRTMGWQGDDIQDLSLGTTEFQIVVAHEEYQGKTSAKVKFVNKLGGPMLRAPLPPARAQAFAERIKARAVMARQNGSPANAPVPGVPLGKDGKPLF